MITKFISFLKEQKENNLVLSKTIEKDFDYFHISTVKLGKEFKFSARVPNMPFSDENGDIIEDNFTKRISLSTTIKGCLDAITDEEVDGYYIYAIKKSDIDTKYILDLSTIKNIKNYDQNFSLRDWLDENGIEDEYSSPNQLPEKFKNMFYGCVPDHNITGEYWYLNDLKMNYVGEVIPWKYGIEKILIC